MNLQELKPHIRFKQISATEGVIFTDLKYSPYIETNMSSREQFKDVIKRDKQTIVNLKRQLATRDKTIESLRVELGMARIANRELRKVRDKRWWQFWK